LKREKEKLNQLNQIAYSRQIWASCVAHFHSVMAKNGS